MCRKIAGMAGIVLAIIWMQVASAGRLERPDVEQDCWRLAPFDDVIVIENSWKHRRPGHEEGPWDFGILARWEGRLPDGTLVYELQGGGRGVEVPDGRATILNLTFLNIPPFFANNPFVRLLAVIARDTNSGPWALEGVGANIDTFILHGTFVPIDCPSEADAVAAMRFGAEAPAGRLAGQP